MSKLGDLEIPVHAELPIPGVAIWRNPFNKAKVIAIHYSADPEKRSAEWKEKTSRGYTEAVWRREYEISFDTFAGMPVYSSFDRDFHVWKYPRDRDGNLLLDVHGRPHGLSYFKGAEMWCGWDIGRHAAVFAQQADRRLFVYGSKQVAGAFGGNLSKSQYNDQEVPLWGLAQFIDAVLEHREYEYPGCTWRDVGDPSIANESIRHDGTSAMVFRAARIHLEMARTNDIVTRVSAVESWLNYAPKGKPGLIIDPAATVIIDGFAGGYGIEKEGEGRKPDKKSPFSHVMDCLQYIVLSLPFSPGNLWVPREERQVMPRNVDAEHLRKEIQLAAQERMREAWETETWQDY